MRVRTFGGTNAHEDGHYTPGAPRTLAEAILGRDAASERSFKQSSHGVGAPASFPPEFPGREGGA